MSPNEDNDKWFVENQPNFRFSLRYTKKLHESQSKFQKLEVYDSVEFGRVMMLDGCVMLTDKDEFVYHELISHIPICHHEDPKSILVIGGGDGGTVRELIRHTSVEQVVLCEIDGAVIDCSKQYFPKVASGLSDERVEVVVGDGIEYVANAKQKFDIVIVDSTDPVGPGVGLFTADFYQNVGKILNAGGVMVAQTESLWEKADVVQKIRKNIMAGFSEVNSYSAYIPTYPHGGWTWTLASNTKTRVNRERFAGVSKDLQYLNNDNLKDVFNLPEFYRKILATTGK